jgi:hypothetical protein
MLPAVRSLYTVVITYSGTFLSVTQQPESDLDCLIVEVRMSHVIRHTHTIGRTPLEERSIRCRDLYLTIHNNHKTDIQAHGGIRIRNSKNEWPQTYALDRSVAGMDTHTHTHTHTYISINTSFILFLLGGRGGYYLP